MFCPGSRFTLCAALLGDETLTAMGFNGGAGAETQEICDLMADRFNLWMEHHVSGHNLSSELKVTSEGQFATEDELVENPDLETKSPFEVDDDHLKVWVDFLRHCGGFEVW